MATETYIETRVITDRHAVNDDAHIPSPLGAANGVSTLCGWCDVHYESYDYYQRPADCRGCIDTLKAIKAMRFPRGYFKPVKREKSNEQ